jgi:modulator of FtsH protease
METRSTHYTTRRRVTGAVDTIGEHAVFGAVMGLVALTLAFTAVGGRIGQDLDETVAIGCSLVGVVSICAASAAARRSEPLAIGALFLGGLLVGLGLGPVLARAVAARPEAVWHAVAPTSIFIAALGASGYAIRRDLGIAGRVLLLGLAAVFVAGLTATLISSRPVDLGYSIGGLVVFGGFTVVDFNLMRRADVQDVVPLAAGIFLDVVNVFLFVLELGDDGES